MYFRLPPADRSSIKRAMVTMSQHLTHKARQSEFAQRLHKMSDVACHEAHWEHLRRVLAPKINREGNTASPADQSGDPIDALQSLSANCRSMLPDSGVEAVLSLCCWILC